MWCACDVRVTVSIAMNPMRAGKALLTPTKSKSDSHPVVLLMVRMESRWVNRCRSRYPHSCDTDIGMAMLSLIDCSTPVSTAERTCADSVAVTLVRSTYPMAKITSDAVTTTGAINSTNTLTSVYSLHQR